MIGPRVDVKKSAASACPAAQVQRKKSERRSSILRDDEVK
jgi:hypothetical protein